MQYTYTNIYRCINYFHFCVIHVCVQCNIYIYTYSKILDIFWWIPLTLQYFQFKPRPAMDVTPWASSLTANCHSELYSRSARMRVSWFIKSPFMKPPIAEVYFLCLSTGTPKETINRKIYQTPPALYQRNWGKAKSQKPCKHISKKYCVIHLRKLPPELPVRW